MSRCDSRVEGIAEAEQLGVSSEQAGRLRRNGPAGCWQLGVLTIDNLLDQLELAEARGVFQCWNVNTNLRQRQKKLRLGLGLGIKRRAWLHGENSCLSRWDQRAQEQSSRQESAHLARGLFSRN